VVSNGPVAVARKTIFLGDDKRVQAYEAEAVEFVRVGAARQLKRFLRVGHGDLLEGRLEEGSVGPSVGADVRVAIDGLRNEIGQQMFRADLQWL